MGVKHLVANSEADNSIYDAVMLQGLKQFLQLYIYTYINIYNLQECWLVTVMHVIVVLCHRELPKRWLPHCGQLHFSPTQMSYQSQVNVATAQDVFYLQAQMTTLKLLWLVLRGTSCLWATPVENLIESKPDFWSMFSNCRLGGDMGRHRSSGFAV